MKTFNIGNNRILKLVKDNDEIHILDKTKPRKQSSRRLVGLHSYFASMTSTIKCVNS